MTSVGFNQLYKFVLVGDSAVGKTSILYRFTVDEFSENMNATIGIDVKLKAIEAYGKEYKLALWDTAGQERFRTLTSSYYRGTHGIVFVYDVTSRATFDSITTWLEEVNRHNTNPDVAMILVGNKVDLSEKREVRTEEAAEWARRHNMMFIETSTKTAQGVHEVFSMVLETVVHKAREKGSDDHSPKSNSTSAKIDTDKRSDIGYNGGCC